MKESKHVKEREEALKFVMEKSNPQKLDVLKALAKNFDYFFYLGHTKKESPESILMMSDADFYISFSYIMHQDKRFHDLVVKSLEIYEMMKEENKNEKKEMLD